MANPTISVIVPTYNRKTILPRAIDSIFAQTYQDFEIIVVDDGSDDGTEAYIEKTYTDPRIRYERLEKNSGVHVARNKGLKLAWGEYIILLDSDDELLCDALEKGIDAIKRDPMIGWCAAAFQTDENILTGFDKKEDGYIAYEDILCERLYRPHKNCFVLLRSNLIKGIEYAAPNVDFIFFRQVAKRSRVYWVAQPLGVYHISEDPSSLHISRRKPNIERSVLRAQALEKFVCEFENDFCDHCPKNLGPYAYGAAVGLLLDGKQRRAIVQAYKAFRSSSRVSYGFFLVLALIPCSPFFLKLFFKLKMYKSK